MILELDKLLYGELIAENISNGENMNNKKILLSVLTISVLLFLMDFVIHGNLLMGIYEETPQLWRPMAEMSPLHNALSVLIYAFLYVMFYQVMICQKSVSQGIKFGCLYGLLGGFAMASSYMYMPISLTLAFGWFLAIWIESIVAGAVVGYFLKDE